MELETQMQDLDCIISSSLRGHVLELEGSIVRDGIFAEAEPIRRERLQLWRVLALLQRLGRLSDQLDGRVDRRRQRERRRRRVRR